MKDTTIAVGLSLLLGLAPLAAARAEAAAPRAAVTIYEFRTSVPGVSGAAATDMFKTALVKTGRFRVVERARVNEGVVREKQLNAAGLASGDSARRPLRGAQFIFEGTISEAAAGVKQSQRGVTIAGMDVGAGRNTDQLGIDVRVIDAGNGDVLDAIDVRVPVHSTAASVSGVGSLVGNVLARKGRDTTFVPDVRSQDSARGSVDAALRAAIEQAVARLSERRASWP